MAAAKTATLHDLAGEIQRQVIRAKSELDDVRRRLDTLRTERETILNKPLASSDLEAEIARHLTKKGAEALDYLKGYAEEIRGKTAAMATIAPEQMAIFDPFDRSYLVEVVAFLSDPQAAAARIVQAVGTLPGADEGLPLEQRRAAVRELDEKIAAAVATEDGIVASLAAAGVQVPSEHAPVPDPVPGERRMIDGKLQQWVSFTGGRNYGWYPVAELGQAA